MPLIRQAVGTAFEFISDVIGKLWIYLPVTFIAMGSLNIALHQGHDLSWLVSTAFNVGYILSFIAVVVDRIKSIRARRIGRCHRCGKIRRLSRCQSKGRTLKLCEDCLYE